MGGRPFKFLLQPGHIGKVLTRNRMYKSAAGMMTSDQDEVRPNPATLAFYEALARGGVGVISVEAPTLDFPCGTRSRRRYRMDDDRFLPGMAELVDRIHEYGCPVLMQMEHDGPWQSPLLENAPATYDGPPIAASPVNIPKLSDFHRDLPRTLRAGEIQEITLKFIDAAARAQRAGFDGVDINCGSSQLIHNFLSPFWNKRDDEYGGNQERRARLMLDIIRGIKARCGADFPIVICINGFESGYCVDADDSACLTHDLATQSMLMAVDAGADALMIRSHWLGLHVPGLLPDYMFYPQAQVPRGKRPSHYYSKDSGRGPMRTMVKEFKRLVSVPLIVSGFVGPELGESILESGDADFIAMNRPLICDPELPNKLATGRREDVAPCTRRGTCLDENGTSPRHCRLNAAVGTHLYGIYPAEQKKKVAVVGGGPAGMEAARVSALRGHDVTLFEKSSSLGGLVPFASLIKGTELEDLPGLVRYLDGQITKLGVRVRLRTAASVEEIRRLEPDVLFVATGGVMMPPKVRGNARRLFTTADIYRRIKPFLSSFGPRFLGRVAYLHPPFGKRAVVIGAGFRGLETAQFLAKRGWKVTVLEPTDRVDNGVPHAQLALQLEWFARKKVDVVSGARDVTVSKRCVTYSNSDGVEYEVRAHKVIGVSAMEPDTSLATAFDGLVRDIYLIGDSSRPGTIAHAIRAAYRAARTV